MTFDMELSRFHSIANSHVPSVVTIALLSETVVSEKSFTWLRLLRYHMDIKNVLRAKQEPVEPVPPNGQPEFQTMRRTNKTVRRKSRKEGKY